MWKAWARQGLEYYRIQHFCRWGSDTILKGLRNSPLENSENWLPSCLQNLTVEELYAVRSLTPPYREKDLMSTLLVWQVRGWQVAPH